MSSQMNRQELLNHINQASFAVDDVKLYLDTHPCDTDALSTLTPQIFADGASESIKYGVLTFI